MTALSRRHSLILLLALMAGCAQLPDEVEHPQAAVVNSDTNNTLHQITNYHARTAPKDATSAVLLQESGWDALSQRLALVEMAEQSIDIQYYIWNSDQSGHYLASRLLAAADRGVKVRVMLDDINLNEREELLIALDKHPNVEIRIFNPIPSRKGVKKWLNLLGDFSRLNRRMHNKSFTVDGAFSIVGGRNIGDEYFDLSDEINFRDRDVLVKGSVVTDIETSFVEYWDSRWSYPVNLLGEDDSASLPQLGNIDAPKYRGYPALPENDQQATRLIQALIPEMTWVKADYITDQPIPDDVDNMDEPKETSIMLSKLGAETDEEILIESAYLVFDDRQLECFKNRENQGLEVVAITNSMASNDLVTNHSAYAGRRQDMLESGIQLFELRPDSSICEESTKDKLKCAPTTAYGLHAKSVVFDRRIVGIGSFNFNLRSTYINTESVLVIDNEKIANQLADNIEHAMEEENSWELEIEDGSVYWHSGEERWDAEPETGKWRQFQSNFLQLLPIEKYL